ncbi:MAG: SsrA-binding protein [Actinobacteria bacterium RBG_16_68_21]|nr:MAG: SsrA-binding protein [Actinobacteria bacterium RBG_16_68_21]
MSTKTIATNRRARFDFEIVETVEAGIVLLGSEVKSLRNGRADLKDSYAAVTKGELWLHGLRISPYEFAPDGGHDPERDRKLLLHRLEIDKIGAKLAERGLTLIPIKLYFKDGKAKVELGLGKGKSKYDKRETLKRRQADREMQRAIRHKSID